MATMSFYDYRAMIEDTPIETSMVEFRDPNDRLVGGCLTDRLGDGLSAVYSFFAPDLERRSLGTYAILWLIGRARELGLPHVYLGYWVPDSRKMAYKARFRPSEILVGGAWRTLTDDAAHGQAARSRAAPVPGDGRPREGTEVALARTAPISGTRWAAAARRRRGRPARAASPSRSGPCRRGARSARPCPGTPSRRAGHPPRGAAGSRPRRAPSPAPAPAGTRAACGCPRSPPPGRRPRA